MNLDSNIVRYSDFGAVGDGVKDDFDALYNAHVYANENNLPVVAQPGAIYYIGESFVKSIPVKTNLTLTGAKIIIDDRGSVAYANRSNALFILEREHPVKYFVDESLEALSPKPISKGQEFIDWLVPVLESKCMVRFTNSNHRDFVRFGSNQNAGNPRTDGIIIDTNGKVDSDTPVVFDFDCFTKIEIFRVDDTPITLDGGYFETICCRAVPETEYKNKYHAYSRGIKVHRPNSTVKNITHRVVDEPEITGLLNESYPYHAFLDFSNTYNATLSDSDLTGHTTYFEDKPATESTNWVKPKPVAMGSYDFVVMYSINVKFIRMVQNGTDIAATKYWGIMASNGCKNLEFYQSRFSRFDAHRGFWGGKIIDCELGHSFNIIGGGKLEVVNTSKMGGSFIAIRGDYGATFDGDVILKNCTLIPIKPYYEIPIDERLTSARVFHVGFSSDNVGYCNWNFGYTCYMPRNIVIDNFKCDVQDLAMFNIVKDTAFDDANSNKYMVTDSITYLGDSETINVTVGGDECKILKSIPITVKGNK